MNQYKKFNYGGRKQTANCHEEIIIILYIMYNTVTAETGRWRRGYIEGALNQPCNLLPGL